MATFPFPPFSLVYQPIWLAFYQLFICTINSDNSLEVLQNHAAPLPGAKTDPSTTISSLSVIFLSAWDLEALPKAQKAWTTFYLLLFHGLFNIHCQSPSGEGNVIKILLFFRLPGQLAELFSSGVAAVVAVFGRWV